VHGSAAWARPAELAPLLKGREAFDAPSSILLGAYVEDGQEDPTGFVHWDRDGHLLTVAPTRSGKALTAIIPNLLRYRGSCVVLDPKGELYAATSKWRAANVGPVYRIAPFDDGSARFSRHGFNPLARVRTQADARALAELMFPRDPKAAEFFSEDAVSFMTALILHILISAPTASRHLPAVRQCTALPLADFKQLVGEMAGSAMPSVADAAHNVLSKSDDRGIPNLRDTLNSKLALWSDEALQESLRVNEVDFQRLKDRPATVYIDIPFRLMAPYAPWLRVVLKAALDAMLDNPTTPEIPVLFVLDEFLSLGPFPEFRDAIRTHAGAGVRLWFFVQDVAALEEFYPNGAWRPFLNCSVKQFFGIDDPYTAELVGKYLGQTTVAQRVTSASGGLSTEAAGSIFDHPSSVTLGTHETIQFYGRPLMTPDEVMALLSDWRGDGWRTGIVHLRGPRPFQVQLVAYTKSSTCRARSGAHIP
jgi:type IV secretion system protein VirD4